jgi:hypothetical protein
MPDGLYHRAIFFGKIEVAAMRSGIISLETNPDPETVQDDTALRIMLDDLRHAGHVVVDAPDAAPECGSRPRADIRKPTSPSPVSGQDTVSRWSFGEPYRAVGRCVKRETVATSSAQGRRAPRPTRSIVL